MKLIALWILAAATTLVPAQNKLPSAQKQTVPPFTGTWILDLHRTTFEGKPHPPIAATVIIRYDGTHWHRWRSHTAPDGKVDTHSMDLIVGSSKPLVVKDGPVTFYSYIARDGDALVLNEEIIANTGEKATNIVRYTLEESGNTLVEFEQEITPEGNETNRWVSTRKK